MVPLAYLSNTIQPPAVLALHMNRSVHSGQYAFKNNVRILFHELLDLTTFTTSGKLSTVPSVPISSPPPSVPRSTTPTPATYSTPRSIYRLSAVVCHYGQHSFGHYICYRRKPRPLSSGSKRFDPPKVSDPLGYHRENEEPETPVWEDEEPSQPGRGWLRISDDSVRECGIDTVLQEGSAVFMLYYERVQQPRLGIYPLRNSPRSSEETLKPDMLTVHVNGSESSLLSESEVGALPHIEEKKTDRLMGPRIVRSVVAGRGRSFSATTSERESSVVSSSETERTPKCSEVLLPNGVANGDAHMHPDPPPTPPASEPISTTSSIILAGLPEPASPIPPNTSPEPPPRRIHSPRPVHAPVGPSMVGLRA
jgi:ubiquitin carboxyl-terminal hydrolase 1